MTVTGAAVLLLAGCASQDPSDAGRPAGTEQRSDAPGTGTAPVGAADGTNEESKSPLEEFLGFRVNHRPEGLDTAVPALNPNAAGPSEEDRRDQRRVEEMIGDCMRAEGFTYVVQDPFSGTAANPKDSPYALPKDEFAAQYGYGISTIDVPEATEIDPNYAAMAAMKPAERQAYLWALDGGAEQGDTQNTGCRGRAVEAVFGRSTSSAADPSDATAQFEPLVGEIRTLDERVDDDPRVGVEANRRWADCMADAGHPGFTKPSEAADSVRARLAQARAGRSDPTAVTGVRHYEVSLARADFNCRKDYDAARRLVRDELERRFLNDHRSDLERYRAAMNPGGAGR